MEGNHPTIQLQQSQESCDEELDVAKARAWARNPEGLHFELQSLQLFWSQQLLYMYLLHSEPEQRLELLSVVYVKLGVPLY